MGYNVKININYLMLSSIIFLSSITIFCQATLLQTFTEDLENSSSFFGTSISKAGDVNNDGFDDIQ